MASLAQRAAEMLESDAGFRAQFDRNSEAYHGKDRPEEYLQPVPLNGAKVPEQMVAHKDWKKLALRDDEPEAPVDLGPEHAAACKLRDDLLKLKKCLIALCAPLEVVVKAHDKLAEIEALSETEKAAPISEEDLATLQQMPDFIPKDSFEGGKPGFTFKLGPQGTGYYNMSTSMKSMEAGAARSQKALERKRKTLQKQVDQAAARLETQTVAQLREQLACVDNTPFRSLRKKIEALIVLALAGGMSMKKYREDWSVQQKRLTEQIFRYHSVDMLAKIKALKTAAGVSLVVPLYTTSAAETETDKENAAPGSAPAAAAGAGAAAAADVADVADVADASLDLAALRKEEQALEGELKELAIAKDKAMRQFEEEAATKEERLREVRDALVKGGHYKSQFQAVLKES